MDFGVHIAQNVIQAHDVIDDLIKLKGKGVRCQWASLPFLAPSPPPAARWHLLTSRSGLEPMLSMAMGLLGALLPAEEDMTWLGRTPGDAAGGGLGEWLTGLTWAANLFP